MTGINSVYSGIQGWFLGGNGGLASRFTRVAAGVGAASLAIVSWKIITAGAVVYTTYRGGRYLYSRCSKVENRSEEASAVVEESAVSRPAEVQAGQERQDDRQEEPSIIKILKEQQAKMPTRVGRNTLEAVIRHPKIREKGDDFIWLQKMVKKHGTWSKRTLGMSLYAVEFYRKYVQKCVPKIAKKTGE